MSLQEENPVAGLNWYEFRNLVGHLVQAGLTADAHRLMAMETAAGRNAWYEARYGAGDVAGFVADVERTWRVAEQSFVECAGARGRCAGLLEEIRYALVLASINTAMSSTPPTLAGPLVVSGVWSLDQAVEFARRHVDWVDRLKVLSSLAGPLARDGRADDVAEAVDHLRGRTGRYRSRFSVGVGASGDVYTEEEVPDIPDEYERCQAIIRMAPVLGADLLHLAESIRISYFRVEALAAVAPFLPKGRRSLIGERGLGDARAVADPLFRARALACLVPLVKPAQRGSLLRWTFEAGLEALAGDVDDRIRQPYDGSVMNKPHALVVKESCEPFDILARQSTAPEVRRALAAARSLPKSDIRGYAVACAYLPRLAELGAVREAEAESMNIPHVFFRAPSLARISRYLPEPSRETRLRQIFEEVMTVPVADHRAYLLASMASHLPAELRQPAVAAALDDAESIGMAAFTADVITTMAGSVPSDLIDRTIRMATGIEHHRDTALERLAPSLTPAELKQVLLLTQPGAEPEGMAGLTRALQTARTGGRRATPGPAVSHVTATTLLRTVRDTMDIAHRARCLTALALYLPSSCIAEARDIASKISDVAWRADAVASLAVLPPDYPDSLEEGLASALGLRNTAWRAAVISRLVPYLPDLPTLATHRAWTTGLRRVARDYRAVMLELLATCAPIIVLLGGEEINKRIVEVGEQVCRWWGRPELGVANASHDVENGSDKAPGYAGDLVTEDRALETLARRLAEDGRTEELASLTDCIRQHAESSGAQAAHRLAFQVLAGELARAYRSGARAEDAGRIVTQMHRLARQHPDEPQLMRVVTGLAI